MTRRRNTSKNRRMQRRAEEQAELRRLLGPRDPKPQAQNPKPAVEPNRFSEEGDEA